MSYPASIYIHVPFCKRRCSYCDFVTFSGMEKYFAPYSRSVCEEIKLVCSAIQHKERVHTIFFGGGTPSLLPIDQLSEILSTVRNHFEVLPETEISLEANPGTIGLEYLTRLRRMGVNRLSLGTQSTNQNELNLLGRIHTHQDTIKALAEARDAGFDNINLDLIYGLPGQTLEDWQQSLRDAINLQPEHLSLYSLTVEEGTSLQAQIASGKLPAPDLDIAADQLEWSCDFLEQAGYRHYEISNWARRSADRDYRARHNLQYWENERYYGFGAGAHSYFDGLRIANKTTIPEYIDYVRDAKENPNSLLMKQPEPRTDTRERMQDEMMLGLRLLEEGIRVEQFKGKYGIAPDQVFGEELEDLISNGLLERSMKNGERYTLTRRGLLLGNQVFMRFVGED